MTIDPRTITFALGITAMYSAIVFATVLRNGARIGGGRFWVAGQGIGAIGLVLGAQRGVLPLVVTLILANALVMTSFALQFEAISRFRKRAYPRRALYAYVAVVVAASVALFIAGASERTLLAVIPAIDAPMLVGVPFQLIVRRTAKLRISERILAGAYCILAAIFVARAAATTLFVAASGTTHDDAARSLLVTVLFTAMLATQTGYVLMTKEETDAELERLATTDALTEVWNRRTFMEAASREVARCRRAELPFALLMFDLDHFKAVNDAYGHTGGDHTLRAFAACARRALRADDLFGRHGGEEFIALLPSASAETALAIAERVRTACEANEIVLASASVRVTISVGVAPAGDRAESLEALVERADRALYAAKARGRNCVVA